MRLSKTLARRSRVAAFSLVEMLMVVAVMSSIAAGAIFTLGSVNKAAESTKLQRDVQVVNSAIRAYRLNGGTFVAADLTSPANLLAKLKKRATADSAKQLAGLRHSYADPRLTCEMQTEAEAVDGVERAQFEADLNNPRFVIRKTGSPGIRRFVLDSNLAANDYGTEARRTTMKLAAEDPWVWDYRDTGNSRDTPGSGPTVTAGATPEAPPDVTTTALSPPTFSLASGTYALNTYPRTVTLTSSNPAGSSRIVYNVDGGPLAAYSGAISIDPGQVIGGMCVALDPDNFDDSALATNTYLTAPLTPIPVVTFAKNSFTFFELGGTPAPGTPSPLPALAADGTGVFSNALLLPLVYHNNSTYRFTWTYDGTSPLSGTPRQQADFSAIFVSTPISLPTLADFGAGTSVTLRTAIRSYKPSILNHSAIDSRNFTVSAVDLRPPTTSTNGRDVTLALDVSTRTTPAGARIFYTTDGTDPGTSAAGDPLSGTEYTGTPITLSGSTGATVTVKSRVYPPQAYRQFFVPSSLSTLNYSLPASTDVYVGGNFVNSSGQPMRNLARLGNSGQVDTRFDTGTGASADSMVGVVRQAGAGVMAGGDFDSMNGTSIMGIVRLNADGSVDAGFNAALTAGP
jgi:type II secretory pathway pseudopilin PulG